nr:thioredoxin family protein [Oscillatoria sp. PCC 10802]
MTSIEMTATATGSYAPDFELPGIDDKVHHLARYLENFQAVGVVFMCNHCPYVGLYLDRLKQIQADFQERGVTLIGINPNDAELYPDDSFENMKTFAAKNEINFPYIRDVTQDVAHCFGAQRTPEVFLLDKTGVVRYHGQIDDSANDPEAVGVPYLRNAIEQLLSGEQVTLSSTEAFGCSVKWRE